MNTKKQFYSVCTVVLFLGVFLGSLPAQEVSNGVPRLVPFSGTAQDALGEPLTSVQGITFAIYAQQEGGALAGPNPPVAIRDRILASPVGRRGDWNRARPAGP